MFGPSKGRFCLSGPCAFRAHLETQTKKMSRDLMLSILLLNGTTRCSRSLGESSSNSSVLFSSSGQLTVVRRYTQELPRVSYWEVA